MTTNFDMVREFHEKYEVKCYDRPIVPPEERITLRWRLINEEYREVKEELLGDNIEIPKLAKELADLLYVTYGTALEFGIDLDKVFAEVHRSNMTKSGRDGFHKITKGPDYVPPDVQKILDNQ